MKKTLNILYLEDDLNDAELIRETLFSGNIPCQLDVVNSRETYCSSLLNGDYDIILSDYSLPSFDGLSALQMVKEHNIDIPFIFISGIMGEDVAIESLTRGATDYVLKNKLSRLVPAVKRAYRELTQMRERNRIENMMQVRLRIFEKIYSSGVSLEEACTVILDEIESQTASSIGFFNILGQDEHSVHFHVFYSNTTADLGNKQNNRNSYGFHDARLWEKCIQTKKAVIYNDFASIPQKVSLAENHVQVVREVVVPIVRNGKVIVIVGVGNKSTEYDDTDIQIISLLVDSTWEILERIKTEEALYKSEERYRMVFENSPVSILEIDLSQVIGLLSALKSLGVKDIETYLQHQPEVIKQCLEATRLLDANHTAILYYKAPNKEHLLDNWSKQISPQIHEILHKILILLWKGETEFTIDGTIKILSGEIRNITLYFTVCPGYEATYAQTLVSVIDITDRKKSEENYRKLSHIVEQSPVSILLTDPEGRIEYVNPKYTTTTGCELQEMIGKTPPSLLQIEKDMELKTKFKQQILSGNKWQGEVQLQINDGEELWEYITVSPIRGEKKEISHLMIIKENITKRKNLEDRIRQTEKLEAIGQMVGGIAHDFNNMLHIILAICQIELKKHDPEETVFKNLTEIFNAAIRAADITKQLLAFARKQKTRPTFLNLNETIEEMIKMLQHLIGENIELNWLPANDLDMVLMDPSQIDQILVNLCVNSRDAIENIGKITIQTKKVVFDKIHCETHTEAMPGTYNQILVTDNGIGMNKEVISKLFEPFFTTKEIGKGTGLGLSTVYGIVKQNKGIVHVDSEPGQGSTFTISFPAMKKTNIQKHTGEKSHNILQGNETILLVEDEPVLVNIVKKTLELFGYRVESFSKPSSVIEFVKQHTMRIHLLISDVIMPEMNGFELAKTISKTNPEIKCLFMSGYPDSVIEDLKVEIGEVEVLQKPFTIQALSSRITKLI